MPAGYWPGPSEGGDVVDSLVLTSELNCFLAEAENLTCRYRRDGGQAGWAWAHVLRGGLAERARGRSRLEETWAAHQATSPGTIVVSCGYKSLQAFCTGQAYLLPLPIETGSKDGPKGEFPTPAGQEGPEVSVESKGDTESDQGNPEQKDH